MCNSLSKQIEDQNDEKEANEKFKICRDDYLIMASLKLPIEVYKNSEGEWKARDGPVNHLFFINILESPLPYIVQI